jgi:hypothetical protein
LEHAPKEMMIEFDLAGAEWVVVAYLSNDANMLGVVNSGKSPHVVTGSLIANVPEALVEKEHKVVGAQTDEDMIRQLRREGVPELMELDQKVSGIFLPRAMSIRQAGKKSNHGLNYAMKYKRFALENEIPEAEAMLLVKAYVEQAYPGIPLWHQAIRDELRNNKRVMTNCFGRKVKLMGEWGQDLFNQAYSFKPQSTVVDSCLQAMNMIYENESPDFRRVRLSAQTHDSVMIQHPVPTSVDEWLSLANVCLMIHHYYMRPTLRYGDLEFKLGCDMKIGINWGHMVPVQVSQYPEVTHRNLVCALDTLRSEKLEHPLPQEPAEAGPSTPGPSQIDPASLGIDRLPSAHSQSS